MPPKLLIFNINNLSLNILSKSLFMWVILLYITPKKDKYLILTFSLIKKLQAYCTKYTVQCNLGLDLHCNIFCVFLTCQFESTDRGNLANCSHKVIQHWSLSFLFQVQHWGLPGADLLWTLWSSEGRLAAVAWPHAWWGDGQTHPARGPHCTGQPLVTSHSTRSHEGWFSILFDESQVDLI